MSWFVQAPDNKDASMELLGDFTKGGRDSLSPGAGLSSADDQAEAALADLMLTSMNLDDEASAVSCSCVL